MLGRSDTDINGVFNGNDNTSFQQKLLPGSLQIHDVDAITLSFIDVLLHLEVKVGVPLVSYCCKEFEDILLIHLQVTKDSGHWKVSL